MLKNLANRIKQTNLGRKALAQPDGLDFLKEKPTPRFYVGLGFMALSYLISLPAFAFCGYLSVRFENPWIAVLGLPAVFIAVHLVFLLGAFLAGGNYAKNTFLWATKRFLEKYAEKGPTIDTASQP